MLKHMRTTVILPDELYRQVKERARSDGRTFTSYLEDVLRKDLALLAKPVTESDVDVYIAKPFNGTGMRPGVERMSNAELLDYLDEGVPIDKLR